MEMDKKHLAGAVLWLAWLGACAQPTEHRSPAGYDLSSPQRYTMPDILLEISGITFRDGDPSLLYAEQDEKGQVFMLRPGGQEPTRATFGKDGDYEDIAMTRDRVLVLRSDGRIYGFPFAALREGKAEDAETWKDLGPKGEYEGLWADPRSGQVVMLCKDCETKKGKERISGVLLQLSGSGQLTPEGTFALDEKEMARLSGKKHLRFKPSALARHPLTGEWYILSSVNKLLVLADSGWQLRQVFALDPSLFPQPEGMAFDKEGTLYISNEGDKSRPATVLRFPYSGGR